MIGYRDTTFCASEVTEHTCGREFTEQDAINAEKWWGGKDYPVAYGKFCKEADNTQPDHIVDVHEMVTDTNQASEDELRQELERLYKCVVYDLIDDVDRKELWIKEVGIVVKALIRTEKLKLLDEVVHQSTINLKSAKAVEAIQSLIKAEVESVLDRLDKSMPTAEQLTTKYGYHMPEKQYGYKLALHDIREVIAKLEAEL